MTRQEIMEGFKIDEEGVITSEGKFFGERIYIPYFWDLILDGCSAFVGDYYYAEITEEDLENFPEMKEDDYAEGEYIVLYEEEGEIHEYI